MPLHLAVIGAGTFGRNHIRLYRELPEARLAAIVEPDPARIAELAAAGLPLVHAPKPAATLPASKPGMGQNPTPIPVYPSTETLLAAIARGELYIDAASVCTPTSTHHAVSAQLLQAGVHILVEKPIAATLDEADDLIALAQQHGRILTVGHLERFNPAVQATLPLLRGPMFFEAHRLSVFSPRSLDTDVVLDLMIHDLDIVLTLVGEGAAVTQVHAVGLPILSGRTDIANVRVEFASGCVANFTASRVSTERIRKLRFFQPHQYLSLDYARQDLLVIEVQPSSTASSANNTSSLHAPSVEVPREPGAPRLASETWVPSEQPSPAGAAWKQPVPPPTASTLPTLSMSKPEVPPAEPLRLELQSFLHSIQAGEPPTVTAPQARNALALALQIQKAIEHHAQHAGLQAFTAH